MIARFIQWSLAHRLCVIALTMALGVAGTLALRDNPLDALPELGEPQVLVYADWNGRSPQEVEDQVTHPLALGLQGVAGVKTVRATSMFGFSLLTVIGEDRQAIAPLRLRLRERLADLAGQLPAGLQVRLGPDATGLGWVYQYYLSVDPAAVPSGHGHDLGELRMLQDTVIRPQLASVPGVAEVGSIGGYVRQYQVELDSLKLRSVGASLSQILQAVAESSGAVGGQALEENGQELLVRGVGLVRSTRDLEETVLLERDGVAVRLGEVSRIQLGGAPRRGALDVDGREVVGGTVVMRSGENSRAVLRRIHARVDEIARRLPPGVTLKPFYDRSELIDRTVATLKRALIAEVLLVTLAHVLFLFHLRSILVVTLPLPLSILGAFLLMRVFGIPSNLMSLSGLAIAIGVLVDAGIVITENAIRHATLAERSVGRPLTPAELLPLISRASVEVGRPVWYAMVIIILAFVPVFLLTGQEGQLFHPLAFTKTFGMSVSTLLALSLVPVLCSWLVRGPFHPEERNPLLRFLSATYDPLLDLALKYRLTVVVLAAALFLAALSLVPGLGHEFMPPLDEGSLLYMPTFAPGTAPSEVQRVMAWQDRVIRSFPEVRSVAGKLGRADTATDPAPVEMIETTIQLHPRDQWRPGLTRAGLVAELATALRQVPGSVPGFLQPIEGRVLMNATGIRSQLGILLLGDDPAALQQAALEVKNVVEQVPGAVGVTPSRTLGKPYLEIHPDRRAMARHGLRVGPVLEAVEVGLGGREVAVTTDGRRSIPIQVRMQRSEREDPSRIRDLPVTAAGGYTIPLGEVAQIRRVEGPAEITSENGQLRAYVQANVQGRDLGSFVEAVKSRVTGELGVRLAERGISLVWVGEYEHQLRAARTLSYVIPAVLLISFLLLRQLYDNLAEAAHVLLAIPFALTGGIFLQAALGWHFSVAVWVGYIALFGTAIQTGVVMVVYLEEAVQRKRQERGADFAYPDLVAAVKEGARLRLRPKLMTVVTIVASLMPVFWGNGTGSEVMQPIATPVVGGMVSSLLHILILTPVLFVWLHGRHLPGQRR